ncbi:hypothetical protein Y032_0043g744 [Ancylostoma ceylanicum]|uniref:Uncharacterized protein n=1 Tax=Ancylostoma ceylanicum TaxID=53326 RepID=A0A016UF14_9BILA|nr:hypothetical protein Y032_0043g744 [Ancylostoma ceylanicum]
MTATALFLSVVSDEMDHPSAFSQRSSLLIPSISMRELTPPVNIFIVGGNSAGDKRQTSLVPMKYFCVYNQFRIQVHHHHFANQGTVPTTVE